MREGVGEVKIKFSMGQSPQYEPLVPRNERQEAPVQVVGNPRKQAAGPLVRVAGSTGTSFGKSPVQVEGSSGKHRYKQQEPRYERWEIPGTSMGSTSTSSGNPSTSSWKWAGSIGTNFGKSSVQVEGSSGYKRREPQYVQLEMGRKHWHELREIPNTSGG